jgi:hypothetical protein
MKKRLYLKADLNNFGSNVSTGNQAKGIGEFADLSCVKIDNIGKGGGGGGGGVIFLF